MRVATPLLLLLLLASGAGTAPEVQAQTPGNCALGTAEADLDVSNVFARVFNTGGLFFGNSTTASDGYIVPRSGNTSPLFAAGLWVGGTVEGSRRVAGARYNNFTFWPGPLDDGAVLPDSDNCAPFDRIFVVSQLDVERYESGQGASGDLTDWPVGLGAPALDASGQPLAVTSRSQMLNLAAGERPVLFGNQTAFWVMNDVGGEHTVLGTDPLGIEVQVIAFAMGGDEPLGAPEATFYRYTVVNRSTNAIDDMHVGFFADPDLGNATDDYMGTDESRNMVFVYNANSTDAQYGTPPALGFDILTGASSTSTFENVSDPRTNDPSTGEQYYNYLQGLWGDGSVVRSNGGGYGQPATFPITKFFYTGNPVTEEYWSEVNPGTLDHPSAPGDRRMVVVAPAVALASGESHTVDLAILFAQGSSRFDSITQLRAVSDAVQASYDANELYTEGPDLVSLAAPILLSPEEGIDLGLSDSVTFSWDAVKGANSYRISWGPDASTARGNTITTETSIRLSTVELTRLTNGATVFWTVRGRASGAIGNDAPARSFIVSRQGLAFLPSGDPVYAEVANADGTDPCDADASSTSDCDAGYGNPVYHSFNSTADFYFSEAMGTATGSETQLTQYVPNDFEIRFTEEGSLAGYLFQQPYNVIRVPFEVWDVGPVGPNALNDPADDVRLIPMLFADNGGTCAFNSDEIPDGDATFGGFAETDRIYAYYAETSYDEFEGTYEADVSAAPNGCFAVGAQSPLLDATEGDRPIQRQVFGSPSAAPALPAIGTIIRMYTTPPFNMGTAAEPSTPEASGALALRIGPNPSRGESTVRLRLDAPEALTVRVLDVLGREVAVLAEGPHASGEHTFALPAGLASGVYAVEARAGDVTATTRVTVVR